ncbi:MAG TPA: hypothetical protein VMR86_21160 [Myxococcota bacterium]|nr:hypothetical protein [Myxococcota bacterium]
MNSLQRKTPRTRALEDMERWVRSVMPRRAPASSPVPRILAGLALALAGAAAALLFAPKNGRDMRALARKRLASLRRQASDFAESHDLYLRRAHNGRGQSQERRP